MLFHLIYDAHDDTFTESFFTSYMLFASPSGDQSRREGKKKKKMKGKKEKTYFPKMHVIYASKRQLEEIELVSVWTLNKVYAHHHTQSRFLGFMIFLFLLLLYLDECHMDTHLGLECHWLERRSWCQNMIVCSIPTININNGSLYHTKLMLQFIPYLVWLQLAFYFSLI